MEKNEKIIKVVCALIKDKTGENNDVIPMESRLKQDLGLDSLDIIELGMDVETHFNIEIPDKEQEAFTTVGEVVACVARLCETT